MPFDLDPQPPKSPVPTPDPEPAPDQSDPTETPEALKARIQAAEAAAEAARREAEKSANAYTSLATQVLQQSHGGRAQIDDDDYRSTRATQLPDPEDDPDGYQAALIEQKVNEKLSSHIAQTQAVQQQQQQLNQLAIQGNIESQRVQFRNDPRFPDYQDNEQDIESYLQQFSLLEQAHPEARKVAYYRVMGEKLTAAKVEDQNRMNSELPHSRPSSSHNDDFGTREPERKFTDREHIFANRSGMSEKSFRQFQGPGTMSIDDFKQVVEQEKKGA